VQRLKLATSNLACSWGFPSPIIKSRPEKKRAWPEVRKARKHLGFPFNISATALLSSVRYRSFLFAPVAMQVTACIEAICTFQREILIAIQAFTGYRGSQFFQGNI